MRVPKTLRKVAKATILYSLFGLCNCRGIVTMWPHWDLFGWLYFQPNAPIPYKHNEKIASLVLNMII